jgi:predicted outer membrane repeat protein
MIRIANSTDFSPHSIGKAKWFSLLKFFGVFLLLGIGFGKAWAQESPAVYLYGTINEGNNIDTAAVTGGFKDSNATYDLAVPVGVGNNHYGLTRLSFEGFTGLPAIVNVGDGSLFLNQVAFKNNTVGSFVTVAGKGALWIKGGLVTSTGVDFLNSLSLEAPFLFTFSEAATGNLTISSANLDALEGAGLLTEAEATNLKSKGPAEGSLTVVLSAEESFSVEVGGENVKYDIYGAKVVNITGNDSNKNSVLLNHGISSSGGETNFYDYVLLTLGPDVKIDQKSINFKNSTDEPGLKSNFFGEVHLNLGSLFAIQNTDDESKIVGEAVKVFLAANQDFDKLSERIGSKPYDPLIFLNFSGAGEPEASVYSDFSINITADVVASKTENNVTRNIIFGQDPNNTLDTSGREYRDGGILHYGDQTISGNLVSGIVVFSGQELKNVGLVSFMEIKNSDETIRGGGTLYVAKGGVLKLDSNDLGAINFIGNYAVSGGGAIYSNGEALLLGSFLFRDNSAKAGIKGGAIYNNSGGKLTFDMGNGGSVVFEGHDGQDAERNSIHNSGEIIVKGSENSIFKIGKNILLAGPSDNDSERITIHGGVKFVLAGVLAQKNITGTKTTDIPPILAIAIEKFNDAGVNTGSAGGSIKNGEIEGAFAVEPGLYPALLSSSGGIYALDETARRYSYTAAEVTFKDSGSGIAVSSLPTALTSAEVGLTIALDGGNKGILTLSPVGEDKTTKIILGSLTQAQSPITVADGNIFTNLYAASEPQTITGVELAVSSGGIVSLVGPATFNSTNINVAEGGKLTLLSRYKNEGVVFTDTAVKNSSDSLVLITATGGQITLGGSESGAGKTTFKGPGTFDIRSELVQKTFELGENPTLMFYIYENGTTGGLVASGAGGGINVLADTTVTVGVNLDTRLGYYFGEIFATPLKTEDGATIIKNSNGSIISATGVKHKDVDFDLKTVVFGEEGYKENEVSVVASGGLLTGNLKAFTIEGGKNKIISNAIFNSFTDIQKDIFLKIKDNSKARMEGAVSFIYAVRSTEESPKAIEIGNGSSLDINGAVVTFKSELKDESGKFIYIPDIHNEGTVNLISGSLNLSGVGITDSATEATGEITVGGDSIFNIGSATVVQKGVEFIGEKTNLLLTVDSSSSILKSGGFNVSGSLKGSPSIKVSFAEAALEAILKAEEGKIANYVEVSGPDVKTEGYIPEIINKYTLATGENGENKFVEIGFGTKGEGTKDFTKFEAKTRGTKEAAAEVINEKLSDVSENKRANMATLMGSLSKRHSNAQEAISSGNAAEIKRLYAQYTPDSNVASQAEAIAVSAQSSADIIADKILATDEFSAAPTAGLLMAAAGRGGVFYGLLKEKASNDELLSRVWSQIFGNWGSQKLEEDIDTSGAGIVLGFDQKLSDNFKLGLAYSFSRDVSKGDLREKTTSINGISLYGNYDFGKCDLKNLQMSTVFTFGFVDNKDNELSGKGSIIYLAPSVNYRFAVKAEKDLKVGIIPEIVLRWTRVHWDEQKSDDNTVKALGRNIITLAPAVKVASLIKGKFELGAKLGLSYDLYNGGDDTYSITVNDGDKYQVVDENAKKTKLFGGVGLSAGYKVSEAVRVSLGYNGKYSSDLTNHSINLEANFRF